jgi:formylglycine-generating enzyme required for sulfatase activity
MEAPSGTLISYAAKPGTRSIDGSGNNGLYTSVLLKYLPIPGLPIEQMLKKVGAEVRQRSGDAQQTWMEGLLDSGDGGDFCFAGCAGRATTPTTPPYKLVEPTPTPKTPLTPAQQPTTRREPVNMSIKTKSESALKSVKACDVCPEMVRLPGGNFMMGSPENELDRDTVEIQHRVMIKQFAIGKYEVTRDQFAAFIEATNYHASSSCGVLEKGSREMEQSSKYSWRNPGFEQSGNHPVVCISAKDAQAYAKWLAKKSGHNFRLPSEAEWEYAARANTGTARYWGNDQSQACVYENVGNKTMRLEYPDWSWELHDCEDGALYTAPIGSYRPNQFGLFDMLGNVGELTCTAYSEGGYYDKDVNSIKCGNDVSDDPIYRGGDYGGGPLTVRAAFRGDSPVGHTNSIGFRVAHD